MPPTEPLLQQARAAAAQGRPAPQPPELFNGPRSLRLHGERRALLLCLLSAPLTIALIGLVFKSVTISDIVLLVVAGMVYVSLSRGRLLGSSVRIHERQLPELHRIVDSVARRLGIVPPQIFVRDDPFVPIAAVGIGEPYALMLSSQYLEHLRPGELRFLVARELAHIAAGHTRYTSLLSVSGRENAVVALIFGAWLRRAEFTADRVGLLCSESLSDAIDAIAITTFHVIGRRIDVAQLADQRREIERQPTLRMGQWTSGTPYAVNRIEELHAFSKSELAQFWFGELNRPRPVVSEEVQPMTTHEVVVRSDCAPNTRRALAFAIDFTIVALILNTLIETSPQMRTTAQILKDSSATPLLKWFASHGLAVNISGLSLETIFGFFVYCTILVALAGQTMGMMVAELRVVTTRFGQVGIGRSIFRYIVASLSIAIFPIAMLGLLFRVHPHDRLSGTRVVRSRTLAGTR
ncbi:MAG: M48 family metalloprotease [Candidatus Eremiobacteraeota bacterium]|nr:M48 family metalloprotease [Candidatus Eremiobacteraeota bacterium]